MNILLVDDDALLRDMYAVKFRENGYEVTTAESGERAIEVLQERSFGVVLFDLVMSNMTGFAFFDAVKKLKLKKRPRFVVLSNQSDDTDFDRAKQAGVDGYIVKAETMPADVVARVEQLIGSA